MGCPVSDANLIFSPGDLGRSQVLSSSASPNTSFGAIQRSRRLIGANKRQQPLVRPGLSRGGPGRAQHLRGGGHKRRVVGHGRLQANGLRDGLRTVFFRIHDGWII